MFDAETTYILDRISSSIRTRKKILNLTRTKILPDREPRLSRILNGKRNKDYPNLLSMGLAEEIAKAMSIEFYPEGFTDLNDMLWGEINWKELAHMAIINIAQSTSDSAEIKKLQTKLRSGLIEFVPFAKIKAQLDYETPGAYSSDSEIHERVSMITSIQLQAIDWVYFSEKIPQYDPFTGKIIYDTIEERLKNDFYQKFNENPLTKFNKRFPIFLTNFFEREFTATITKVDNSIGAQAYRFEADAIATTDDIYDAEINQSSTEVLDEYLTFVNRTIDKLTEFQQRFGN